jgi:Ca-activated chloride channel homolog
MTDHPQLTAYLLGELSLVEIAAFEQQLAASPELQQELDALRQTVAALESAFAQHVDTQPAVPAIDRERLHSLLRSAVGAVARDVERTPTSVPPGPGGPSYGTTGHGATVAAPALLASAPTAPARGATTRGWLLAGTVLVVGGLIGLSQMETGYVRPPSALLTQPGPMMAGAGPGVLSILGPLDGPVSQSLSNVELKTDLDVVDRMLVTNGTTPNVALGSVAATVNPSDPAAAKPVYTKAWGSPSTANPTSGPVNNSGVEMFTAESAVVSGGTALGLETLARDSDVVPLYVVPAPGGVADYGFIPNGPSSFLGRNVRLAEQEPSLAAFGTRLARGRYSGRYGDTDGETALGLSLPPVNALFAHDYSESLGESRAKRRFLQRGEAEVTELSTESLMLTDDLAAVGQGLSLESRPDSSRMRHLSLDMWGELPALNDFIEVDDSAPQPGQPQGATPRIIISQEEEELLGVSEKKERESGLREQQSALPPSLTVNDYEKGFIQLGKAVENWDRFSRGGQSRGIQPAEPKEPALSELQVVRDLDLLITNQQTEFKALREKSPGIEGKPLTEAAPEVAKNAELALLRVRRELAHQQAVWYYREGYIRQLEATLAAAEQYAHVPENDFVTPEAQPLSTFGIDVDTASYSNVRRFVEAGQLPPPDAVRIEELVNSFQYEGPKVEGEAPLAVAAEVSVCPWQPQHQLLRVALKGKSIDLQQRPPARLVFLVDTSGSMSDENKLPLVKQSLRILVEQMREQDRLSIVTYSDNAGLLLDSTGGDKREAILAAIEGLHSDGSTNGEAGLKLAYETAVKQFGEGATNRVMLCTDGDFNVGESADSELVKLIEKQRQTGVFLNIFGFGSGNLKDAKLEAIADKGNGQYIYIDGIKEARKTLLNELTGTLYTIAKDVKLQIEFNPNLVGSYRLVGYENRVMAAKDFNNDKVDSGDMGAGHSVVALYEIVPPGAVQPVAPKENVEPLKYKRAGSVSARSEPASPVAAAEPAQPAAVPADPLATELCTIRVRYKQPTSNESTKIETVVSPPVILGKPIVPVTRDHVWATAVAEFGLVAKHSSFVGTGNYSQILELAQSALGDDPTGQRREFITLVRQAQHLTLKHEARLAELSDHIEGHRRAIQQIKAVEQAPDLMTKANCSGKYKTLLRQIEVADDQPTYGEFKDFGRWEGHEYKTHQNLPSGYWVYVAPHWYIWGESTEQAAVNATK